MTRSGNPSGVASRRVHRFRWNTPFARRIAGPTGLALAIGAWQLLAHAIGDPFFPTPAQVGQTAYQLWLSGPYLFTPAWTSEVLPSLGRVLGGWAIAVVVGIPAGIGLGRAPRIAAYLSVPLALGRSTPTSLLIPILLATLGFTSALALSVVAIGAVWPILLTSMDGARNLDPVLVDTARALRISRPQWIVHIVLPAAAPRIFTGLRQSMALACILMVVAETVGLPHGIGTQLLTASHTLELRQMWAWLVLLAMLGAALAGALHLAERRLLPWLPARHSDTH